MWKRAASSENESDCNPSNHHHFIWWMQNCENFISHTFSVRFFCARINRRWKKKNESRFLLCRCQFMFTLKYHKNQINIELSMAFSFYFSANSCFAMKTTEKKRNSVFEHNHFKMPFCIIIIITNIVCNLRFLQWQNPWKNVHSNGKNEIDSFVLSRRSAWIIFNVLENNYKQFSLNCIRIKMKWKMKRISFCDACSVVNRRVALSLAHFVCASHRIQSTHWPMAAFFSRLFSFLPFSDVVE